MLRYSRLWVVAAPLATHDTTNLDALRHYPKASILCGWYFHVARNVEQERRKMNNACIRTEMNNNEVHVRTSLTFRRYNQHVSVSVAQKGASQTASDRHLRLSPRLGSQTHVQVYAWREVTGAPLSTSLRSRVSSTSQPHKARCGGGLDSRWSGIRKGMLIVKHPINGLWSAVKRIQITPVDFVLSRPLNFWTMSVHARFNSLRDCCIPTNTECVNENGDACTTIHWTKASKRQMSLCSDLHQLLKWSMTLPALVEGWNPRNGICACSKAGFLARPIEILWAATWCIICVFTIWFYQHNK